MSVCHDSGRVDLPAAFFSCSLHIIVLLSPPPSKYFQSCLHDVAHVLACIIIHHQCLTLQGLPEAVPDPLLFLAHTCGLGLCLFLVRWSVIYCQDGCFMVLQRRIARRVSQSQF